MGVDQSIYIFDYEVFAFDWLLVSKEVGAENCVIGQNENDSLTAFMETFR